MTTTHNPSDARSDGRDAELAALREQAVAISLQINEIEEGRRSAEMEKLVGRCFRYRNSYSCPQSDAERWWLYSRVLVNADGDLRAFRFQTDQYGKVEIEETGVYRSTLGEEISAAEFNKALHELRNSLAQMFNARGVIA